MLSAFSRSDVQQLLLPSMIHQTLSVRRETPKKGRPVVKKETRRRFQRNKRILKRNLTMPKEHNGVRPCKEINMMSCATHWLTPEAHRHTMKVDEKCQNGALPKNILIDAKHKNESSTTMPKQLGKRREEKLKKKEAVNNRTEKDCITMKLTVGLKESSLSESCERDIVDITLLNTETKHQQREVCDTDRKMTVFADKTKDGDVLLRTKKQPVAALRKTEDRLLTSSNMIYSDEERDGTSSEEQEYWESKFHARYGHKVDQALVQETLEKRKEKCTYGIYGRRIKQADFQAALEKRSEKPLLNLFNEPIEEKELFLIWHRDKCMKEMDDIMSNKNMNDDDMCRKLDEVIERMESGNTKNELNRHNNEMEVEEMKTDMLVPTDQDKEMDKTNITVTQQVDDSKDKHGNKSVKTAYTKTASNIRKVANANATTVS